MSGIRKSYSGSAVATTLVGTINSSVLTFSVAAITNWPDTVVGPFVVTIDRGDVALEEKLLCESFSGTTVTVTERGYDGTTGSTHGNGAPVTCTLDANTIDQANDVVNGVGSVTPSTSGVGDAAVDGTSQYPAAGDHKHAREGFASGITSPSAPGDTGADGTSVSPARADHNHPRESLVTLAADLGPEIQGLSILPIPSGLVVGRFVGVNTVPGAPSSGNFDTGDFITDSLGVFWACTVGGAPGTWVASGATGNPAGIMAATAQTLIAPSTVVQITNLAAFAGSLKGGVTVATNGITVPVTGNYGIAGQIPYQNNGSGVGAGGQYDCLINRQGTQILQNSVTAGASSFPCPSVSIHDYPLTAGDVITLSGFQTSSGTQGSQYTAQVTGGLATWLSVTLESQ